MEKTIGVAIIAKNEGEVIETCLTSVLGADQIVVVDTGSDDNTIEIAKRFTDEVYNDFTWCDSFCKARNHVREKMKTDWILSIDCDEYLHNFQAVRDAVKLAEEKGALAVDVFLYAGDNGQTHRFPRLFKNCKEVWWEGAIHNHLSVRGEDLGKVEITYGYSPAHLKDPNRALRILEKEVKERGVEAVREMFYLGREYYYRNRWEDALVTLGKYVQRSKYLPEKAEAFLMMSRSYWNMGMGEDARDACLQAIKINPNFREAILFMADLSWPESAITWRNFASHATNKGVLFVRT